MRLQQAQEQEVAEAVENALHVGYRCAHRGATLSLLLLLGRLCNADSAGAHGRVAGCAGTLTQR